VLLKNNQGKTLQTATTLNIIATQLDRAGIFLVVVPLSTLSHWLREFNSWTDLNAIVYHGTADDRQTIREFEMAYEQDRPQGGVGINQYYLRKCGPKKFTKKESPWMAQVVITTPEMLVSDAELFAIHWTVVVVDEAQKCKNINSKMSVQLRQHAGSIDHMILLSGTPIQNNMEELFALLTLIDPEAYPDADAFMEKYGDLKNKTKDVVDSLHAEVRPYILRRMKEDVETSVPPKEETIIEVELTMSQKTYYKALLEKNIRFLHKNKSKALDGPSLSNLAMQLRKCCNSVLLLNGIEEELAKDHDMVDGDFLVQSSGKLVLLDKLLPRLREQGHRVLIFSQFKIMLDILEE
jgi:SNF2 family DNA or RNA helicase